MPCMLNMVGSTGAMHLWHAFVTCTHVSAWLSMHVSMGVSMKTPAICDGRAVACTHHASVASMACRSRMRMEKRCTPPPHLGKHCLGALAGSPAVGGAEGRPQRQGVALRPERFGVAGELADVTVIRAHDLIMIIASEETPWRWHGSVSPCHTIVIYGTAHAGGEDAPAAPRPLAQCYPADLL